MSDFLSMHKNALVHIDEEALLVPDGTPNSDVPANIKALVEQSISAASGQPGWTDAKAQKLREESYAAHRANLAKTTGGY